MIQNAPHPVLWNNIIGSIDVAQLFLVVFIAFVLALFLYLRREDKREGYPLEDPAGDDFGPNLGPSQGPSLGIGRRLGRKPLVGFPLPPPPRLLKLMHGQEAWMPHPEGREKSLLGPGRHIGAPFIPQGDPMLIGVGPASWASKKDEPLLTWEGHPQLQPLRILEGWSVVGEDPDPRGMPVFDADGTQVGHVVDIWLDHGVKILRYLEVALTLPQGPPRAMIPIYFAEVSPRSSDVRIAALFARHFATFPQLREQDTITAREEDQVSAYCAGGLLYGYRRRQGLA